MSDGHEEAIPGGTPAPDDACWVVRPIEYVDHGEPLTTGIFDDPDRLNKAWTAALATLQTEANDPAATQDVVERASQRISERRAADKREADAAEHKAETMSTPTLWRAATSLRKATRRLVALEQS